MSTTPPNERTLFSHLPTQTFRILEPLIDPSLRKSAQKNPSWDFRTDQTLSEEKLNRETQKVRALIGTCLEGARSSMLKNMSSRLTHYGHIDLSLAVALIIPEEADKCNALSEIAQGLIQNKKNKNALTVLHFMKPYAHHLVKIDHSWSKDSSLMEIAKGFSQCGQIETALLFAKHIQEDLLSCLALKQIASDLRDLQYCDAILEIAGSISNPDQQGSVLNRVSNRLADFGQMERAIALFYTIPPSEKEKYKSKALLYIVPKLENLERIEEFLSFTRQLPDDSDASAIFSEISQKLASFHEIERAIAIAQSIPNEMYKYYATKVIIKHLPNSTYIDQVQELLEPLKNFKDSLRSSLAIHYAKQREIKPAITLIKTLNRSSRDSCIRQVCAILEQQGQTLEARIIQKRLSARAVKR